MTLVCRFVFQKSLKVSSCGISLSWYTRTIWLIFANDLLCFFSVVLISVSKLLIAERTTICPEMSQFNILSGTLSFPSNGYNNLMYRLLYRFFYYLRDYLHFSSSCCCSLFQYFMYITFLYMDIFTSSVLLPSHKHSTIYICGFRIYVMIYSRFAAQSYHA
jgi:hypothetical protein